LKNIMVQAENINADALLGLSCLTNGRAIQCESQALKHDFSMPDQNTEEDTLNLLFGSRFYENPADIPAHAGVGNSISVTFYVLKPSLRWVGGESVQNSKKWWGLQQKSVTLVKPTIPALCIDSLAFIAAQIKPNQGVVNFNCYASTSALAGYVQVNAEANALNLPLEPQK
ncbi:MAG: hypothetical protein EBX40_06790, partial [Gammaproteobacteria bacterium]|nr:hypothetical protein [Gammaproteobacteria bacterium]